MVVGWVKTVPAFRRLSVTDQTVLLQHSWHELFLLTAAECNFTFDPRWHATHSPGQ